MDARDENIDDPQEGPESLFIVEGLSESAEEEQASGPQIFEVMTPALAPEEDAQAGLELSPLSINLGEAEAATPVEAVAEDALGEELAEEIEEEETGIPPLYKWGSVAAAFLVLAVGGAVYWKKTHRVAEPAIAKVPARVVPKVEAPAPETRAPEAEAPAPVVAGESELVAVAPPPAEEPTATVEQPEQPVEPPAAVAQPEPAPAPAAEPVRPMADPIESNSPPRIRRGEGILQLKNGNLFPGRVMKVTAKDVVLRVAEGDYVFPIDDIVQVLPSGSKDYEGFPNGFVELANGNRIWGRILDRGEDTVTVASGIAKIVLKRGEIVGVKLGLGVGIIPQ